jgi:hypothetical protein
MPTPACRNIDNRFGHTKCRYQMLCMCLCASAHRARLYVHFYTSSTAVGALLHIEHIYTSVLVMPVQRHFTQFRNTFCLEHLSAAWLCMIAVQWVTVADLAHVMSVPDPKEVMSHLPCKVYSLCNSLKITTLMLLTLFTAMFHSS